MNQPNLKSNWVNQDKFLHADRDWRKIKVDLTSCSWEGSKILLANQFPEFLQQQYIEKDEVNQAHILGVDRDSGKAMMT